MIFWGVIFCFGAVLNVLLGLHGWPSVLAGNLADPDSYMRLERLLQGIAKGHLQNIVARDDSGASVLVEWSHLLDFLLWIMAAPFAWIAGWKQALFVAGVALGPLSVGFLGVCLAFAARPFAEDSLLWTAGVAAALLPGLSTFAQPGVIHYHILLLAFIALSNGCIFRAWRGGTGYAFLGGLAGGLAIWLTPETMPFILLGFAALFLRWLEIPIGETIAACAAGFFDMLGFGFAIDPPQGGYAVPEIDRLSLVYVVLGLFILCGGTLCARLENWPRAKLQRPVGAAVMAGLILTWIALFPKVAMGPYGIMDAADMQKFFGVIQEQQPVKGLADVTMFLGPGILAAVYAAWRAFGTRSWPWAYLAACIFLTLILGQKYILFIGFSAAIAAVLLPVCLSHVNRALRARPAIAMSARLAILALVLVIPAVPGLRTTPSAAAAPDAPSCDLRQIGTLLAPFPGSIILAPMEDTPELLYRSEVKTVGSLYHHGLAGYLRARAAWRSPTGSVESPDVTATGATYVLFCHSIAPYAPVAGAPPGSLWDTLNAGTPPPWLTLRASDPATGWKLFVVR